MSLLRMTPLAALLIDVLSRRGVVVPPTTGALSVDGETAIVVALLDGFREFGELSVDGMFLGLTASRDTLAFETSPVVSDPERPVLNRPAYARLARQLYLVDEHGDWQETQYAAVELMVSTVAPVGLFDDRASHFASGGPGGRADEWARIAESILGPALIERGLVERAEVLS